MISIRIVHAIFLINYSFDHLKLVIANIHILNENYPYNLKTIGN